MMMLSTSTIGFTAPHALTVMHSRPVSCKMQAKAEAVVADPDAGKFCYGLPGSIAPIENFDPAGFLKDKTKAEVYTLREAELTHGRVGMLAALGFLVQEWWHPLFGADGGPAISQMPKLPAGIWVAMIFGVGIAEGIRVARGWNDPTLEGHFFQKLKPGYYPGNLGFDPLGLKPTNDADLREMQTKELQNGRLGMLAAAGFMAQEAVTGDTWGAYFGVASNPFQ
ncbi:stress-related chlorophyll a b binding protein 2 [Chrysochromulina tobinii]|jgi:hypothetical protein|uniref:Stress-related chlorophyll a b binding protein 2 n=1 Tax=Chrysochromulina tobinii TaxID=1460289 RepID=A0A0M0JN06_9EUKA|nr:stress-related chlorophyll a b binding protein 2 [Chrysochromulina tobinii]|eukprot:KOO27643.1 stress-related chlorophyll a b binding protein 2 [Chrysochromulina sp. CCMP291]